MLDPSPESVTDEIVKIEIPVGAATALALSDHRRLKAVGHLIDRMVRPGTDDPLAAVLEATAAEARSIGLSQKEIEVELDAYNAERRC